MPEQLLFAEPPSELDRLMAVLGVEFPSIQRARADARAFRQRFEDALSGMTSADTTVVVLGSLARDEFRSGIDVDWTLLVDGIADPKHLDLAHRVRDVLQTLDAKQPGPEGVFGNMAFSHDIVHQIGGEDDTNSNTTRRILLILESRPIGRSEAFNRVLNHLLSRYVAEDARFLQTDVKFHVPRFLLDDIARYWRTMAVDFAYKRRTRALQGAAIRNVKLRMSRKLIYASGLLACFSSHVPVAGFAAGPDASYEYVRHLRRVLGQTPLEIVASVVNHHSHLHSVGLRIFSAYESFLTVLRNDGDRGRLAALVAGAEEGDALYQDVRRATHEFRDGLLDLFFDEPSGLGALTRTYGVF